MALNINFSGATSGTTAMTTTAGAKITTAHIRIRKIENENESTIDLRLRMWLSEDDFLAGRSDIWVEEIPYELKNIVESLNATQYANADNSQIQGVIKNMLEDGDSNNKIQTFYPNLVWEGLGIGFYYAKYFKPFIKWVKGGVEDGDGKLENKELQIAFFSILAAFMIFSIALWKVNYPEIAFYGVFGGAGVLYAINRIVDGVQKIKGKEEDKDKKQ